MDKEMKELNPEELEQVAGGRRRKGGLGLRCQHEHKAIIFTPKKAETITIRIPIAFLHTSIFKCKSALPNALITLRFVVCKG